MCLGIPGKIISIEAEEPLRSGRVSFGGTVREVCLAYVPEAGIGEYVVVHVGFAISVIDPAEAKRTFAYLAEIGDLDQLGEPDELGKQDEFGGTTP